MIIPLGSIKLNEEQLEVARSIAISEVCDVAANMEIFADSIRRTYLFKDMDLMKFFYDYLATHHIPRNGQGLNDERLQELFFHYHDIVNEESS